MPAVIVRTLRHEFRLIASDAAGAEAFAFMAIEPEIVGTCLKPVELELGAFGGFHSLVLPGGRRAAGTSLHLLGVLHRLIFLDALQSEPGSPLVHGATIVGPWGRALLVGAKASGKTTLALHLLSCGHRVEGDEHLVIGGDAVMARPRTLRVKRGSLDLVPDLAEAIRRCPFIRNWDGATIHAVDPSIAGLPWRIERGRLDHLVFLDANHGGRSVMTPIPRNLAFKLLLDQSLLPRSGVSAAVAALRRLAMSAGVFRLSLGDLEGARWHLLQLKREDAESSDF
jgi:hypothetical protein